MVLRLDRCHPCLLLTRHRQEAAPTSENEHLLAPRCVPKATTTVAHYPFLPRCTTPDPSCVQATHHTIPPPRATGATSPFFCQPSVLASTTAQRKQALIQIQPAMNIAMINSPQGASPIATHLETSNTNTLATLSLQSRPPLSGFHASRPDQSLWATPPLPTHHGVQQRRKQSSKQTEWGVEYDCRAFSTRNSC